MLVMSALEEFIRKELAFVKNYIRDAPTSLFVAFRSEFDGLREYEVKAKQQELYELYLNSTDKNTLSLTVCMEEVAQVILKPASFRIMPNGDVVITTKGGSKLVGHYKQFGKNKKEILNNLMDWLYVEVEFNDEIAEEYGKDAYLITHVDTLKGSVDIDTAADIVNKYEIKPIEALIAGFGIKPTKETVRLFYPRILSLFSYQDRPVHCIQFTNVETGKTEFGTRLEFVFSWTFYSEFPSVADLIYDGRNGHVGTVFTSQGIIIDEMDKVSKHRFVEAYQPLNTGLENGVWRRGVSIHGRRLEVYRKLPFLLFGNCNQGNDVLFDRLYDNSRQTVKTIIDSALHQSNDDMKINIFSFLERFAICDVFPQYVPIADYVIMNEHHAVGVLPDPILRGLVEVLQDEIETEYVEPTENCKGRMRRHSEAVLNITKVLFDVREIDHELVRQVVVGESDVGNLVDAVYSPSHSEPIKQDTPKETTLVDDSQIKLLDDLELVD